MRIPNALILTILLLVTSHSFSEELLEAEKEILSNVPVGDGAGQVSFSLGDEGFYAPYGPFVGRDAELRFYPLAGPGARDSLVLFYKNKWSRVPLLPVFANRGWSGNSFEFVSQQGTVGVQGNIRLFDTVQGSNDIIPYSLIKTLPEAKQVYVYPVPLGAVIESSSPRFFYSLEATGKAESVARGLDRSGVWLQSQKGGFSIGQDGQLYRDGILWSVVKPKELEGTGYRYLGRLMSGHTIWAAGYPGMDEFFAFADATGQVVSKMHLPWAGEQANGFLHFFTYSIGPWGELYCLIPPPELFVASKGRDDADILLIADPPPKKPAQLVVVRSHLQRFGRLIDSGVRLRSSPSTTAEILGTFPSKTGFSIIEKGDTEETIGGKRDYWYHVRLLDGKEGWFFGSLLRALFDGPNGKAPPWPNTPDW